MVLILLQNTLESKVQVIFNMLKYFIVFIFCFINFSVLADSCVDYKGIPKINVLNPGYKTSVVLSDEPMDKYHGNVLATLIEDYDIVVDIFSSDGGYCVVLKSVDALIGYNDFSVKIDGSHIPGSCSYDAILNHEKKHIDAYLSVIKDLKSDIENSVFNSANSVMPIFVQSRTDIDFAIEEINHKMTNHPESILMKQKINAAQEIRNKRVDQNEDNSELKSCFLLSTNH